MKKGFTIIELLAVLVILGMILIVAVPEVLGMIDANENESYVLIGRSAISSSRLYISSNDYQLPTTSNNAIIITFEDMNLDYSHIDTSLDLSSTLSYVLIDDAGNYYVTVVSSDNKKGIVNLLSTFLDDGGYDFISYDESGLASTDPKNETTMMVDTEGYGILDDLELTIVEMAIPIGEIPVISLTGDNPLIWSLGVAWSDPGGTVTDTEDGTIPWGNVVIGGDTVDVNTEATYSVTYNVTDSDNNAAYQVTRTVQVANAVYAFSYTGVPQTFNVPISGTYQVELWGAGVDNVDGGLGVYVSAEIDLTDTETIYVYVGEAGQPGTPGVDATSTVGQGASATWNGGGAGGDAGGGSYPYSNYSGGASGGGATDIRLTSGSWNDVTSLRSRIIVAGGGGGNVHHNHYDDQNSNAGGTSGEAGAVADYIIGRESTYSWAIPSRGSGATQTTGGTFGTGGTGADSGVPDYCNGHSGGGGGYYGGDGADETGGSCFNMGGGGGSSFISGITGYNAVDASGTHTGSSTHFSGKVFTNSTVITGDNSMPNPSGGTMTGNSIDGYARITFLGN